LLEFLRLTVELDARYFVFENVKGITIGEHKKLLEELVVSFRENGYDVVLPYQVLNAADFSVPQDRRRLFLMGAKKGLPLPVYPLATSFRTTVWEAIGDLPEASEYPELNDSDRTAKAAFGKPSAYAKRLRESVVDPTDFSHPRLWNRKILTSSMLTEHTELSQKRFQDTAPGCVEPISRFLKLDRDGICNTLRAGTGSDKGAFTSPRPIHPDTPRCITVREAARIHSYPDWFRLHATKWHGFRQIGNSVPPLLGRAVAGQVPGAAARYYGVSDRVTGRRLRLVDRPVLEQLAFVSV
jgi:DNA (cytosine-5)-methyltransferase 1